MVVVQLWMRIVVVVSIVALMSACAPGSDRSLQPGGDAPATVITGVRGGSPTSGISEIPDTAGQDGASGTEAASDVIDARQTSVVSLAWERWKAQRPAAYRWRTGGTLAGVEVEVEMLVHGDRVEHLSGSRVTQDLSVDGLFAEIMAALGDGHRLEVGFDHVVGYPTVVAIESIGRPPVVDLVVRDFEPIVQPTGCRAEPGAPTDLAAEPLEWLIYTDFIRWVDGAGCPVRIDVISDVMGPRHCGWETSEWITIGTPLGAPIRTEAGTAAATARTFIWDPNGAINPRLPDVSMSVGDLPTTAAASQYRVADAQLWLDELDPDVLYCVHDGRADQFVHDPNPTLCS